MIYEKSVVARGDAHINHEANWFIEVFLCDKWPGFGDFQFQFCKRSILDWLIDFRFWKMNSRSSFIPWTCGNECSGSNNNSENGKSAQVFHQSELWYKKRKFAGVFMFNVLTICNIHHGRGGCAPKIEYYSWWWEWGVDEIAKVKKHRCGRFFPLWFSVELVSL